MNIQTASYNRFQITEEIKELEAPESRKGQFATQTFKLKKAGGAIAYSDEAMMQNWTTGIDPINFATQNLASDVVRVKAKKIAASLAALATSAVATGDFSAFANSGALDHADKRPLLIFGGMFNEIYTNYGNPDTVASNNRTYQFFQSNPDITPIVQGVNMTSLQPGTVPAKGLPPGTSWFIDNSLPDNYLYYYDKRAIWFLQGPSRTSNYRDEIPGQSGVLFRDWHNSFVYQSGFGKKMTSIAP